MNNENQPLVTVVTITYNLIEAGRKEYFMQCLGSVRNQTYKNVEHIVIDGASNDGTVDLIKKYVDRGWVGYVSESDDGIYDAMNKGIKKAKGKYVVFLNSDDFYHGKTGIESSVELLEKSNADFSYAPAVMQGEDGKNDIKHPHCSPNIKNVFFTMPFCHQTMFTRRDVLMREQGFDDADFKSAGDYDLLIRLCLKKYESVFVNNVFTTYRWGGFSISLNELSIQETSSSYFKNYNKLTKITQEECDKIYCTSYANIPLRLAKKLKNYKDYFDYARYGESCSFEYDKLKNIINKDYDVYLLKQSKSFQLGSLFFRSIKKPYKLITYSYNFIKILMK